MPDDKPTPLPELASQPPPRHAPSDHLASYLADHDAPCPSCGYNLRKLLGEHCPECNQLLELRIGLVEPRIAAFVTGLIGLAMGVGFNGLILVFFVIDKLRKAPFGPSWSVCVPLVCSFAILGSALWIWLHSRGRIGRSPAALRWTVATICHIASIASAILFFSTVN